MAKSTTTILAEQVDRSLATLTKQSQRSFSQSIRTLNKQVQALLLQLDITPSGKIRAGTTNLKTSTKLRKELSNLFLQTYDKTARQHVSLYTQINALVQIVYSDLRQKEVGFTTTDFDSLRSIRSQDYQVHKALSRETQSQLAKRIYATVLGQGYIDGLSRDVEATLVGYPNSRGTPLTAHANAYAQDQIMAYHASSNTRLGQTQKVRRWKYVGSLISTSREFCERYRGQTKTETEWRRIGENQSWHGKSCSDIFICRGGYNCRHHFQAVFS